MDVREIDAANDEALDTWWAVHRASRIADWPDDPPFTLDEVRGMATGGFGNRVVLAVAHDASDRPVGCSMASLPTRDNTWTLNLEIEVDPEHRRRGAGRALVAHAETLARSEGRTTLQGAYEERLDAPSPGRAFSEHLGYVEALRELRRDLRLPVDSERLDALETACRLAEDYDVVTWLGKCPEDLVEGRLELERVMSRDAPHGDLDHELQVWDEARLRVAEATVEDMGHMSLSAGAVAEATGLLVAVTTIGVARDAPATGHQFATIVKREDRGHRLGMLVKIANLRALTQQSPATVRVMTWNGETNSHMSRVNDELGFEVAARAISCQRQLGQPAGSRRDA